MAETDLIRIVNEQDQPIGNETMKKAWEDGLIHRVVRVMVEDKQGRILLQKRTAKILWPNCWDNSAAGHVNADEEYLTAAKRELFEEIGISADKLQEIGTYYTDEKYDNKKLKKFNRVYKIVLDKLPENISNSEVAEVRPYTLQEIKELISSNPEIVTDGLRDVMSRYY